MQTQRPARVLHIITRLILGGAQENTLYSVIGQHRHPDFDVTLLAGIDDGPEGNIHDRAHAAGVDLALSRTLVRPIAPLTDLRSFFELYWFIRRGRYDIVHTHSTKAGMLGRVAARLAGVPIVVHTLHSLVFHEYQEAWRNWVYIQLKRLCAPITDKLISVNQKTLEGALAHGIGRPSQHIKIFSGMELEPFLTVRDELDVEAAKQKLGIPPDALVAGKIARMFPLKGHPEFFAAVEVIARREPRAWFLLVGDGVLKGELEQRARRMGISDRVVFAGLVPPEEVPSHIQAMDVAVHTSLREGIARVLPQAEAVGKPVVTFALDGAPEVIEHGVSGYLAPPGDTDAIAEHVLELFADPEKRRAFGEAGREFASTNYGVDLMVQRINEVYYELLRSHPEVATIKGRSRSA